MQRLFFVSLILSLIISLFMLVQHVYSNDLSEQQADIPGETTLYVGSDMSYHLHVTEHDSYYMLLVVPEAGLPFTFWVSGINIRTVFFLDGAYLSKIDTIPSAVEAFWDGRRLIVQIPRSYYLRIQPSVAGLY